MSSRGMAWFCGESSGSIHCWNDPPSIHYSETEVAEILRKHKEIETQIEKDKKMASKTMKILLLGEFSNLFLASRYFLGGPESGKSTIFKQMRYFSSYFWVKFF
jgi:hypothetical protein